MLNENATILDLSTTMKNSLFNNHDIMKSLIVSILGLFLAASCALNGAKKENWMSDDSKQILFSNIVYTKNNGGGYGGNSVLIEYNEKTFAMCTKHILFGPGQKLANASIINHSYDNLKDEINQWQLVSRDSIKDTLNCKFYNESMLVRTDIIILSIAENTSRFQKLVPRFDPPEKGDVLYVIDCPIGHPVEAQKKYKLVTEHCKYDDSFLTKMDKDEVMALDRFSGAPVVDSEGRLIGMVNMISDDNVVVSRLSLLEGTLQMIAK